MVVHVHHNTVNGDEESRCEEALEYNPQYETWATFLLLLQTWPKYCPTTTLVICIIHIVTSNGNDCSKKKNLFYVERVDAWRHLSKPINK